MNDKHLDDYCLQHQMHRHEHTRLHQENAPCKYIDKETYTRVGNILHEIQFLSDSETNTFKFLKFMKVIRDETNSQIMHCCMNQIGEKNHAYSKLAEVTKDETYERQVEEGMFSDLL